ncbi:MAG: hypothetical protein IKL65_04430 [Bacilli bacterium]|nr:hypothetical protein [Bacilli bacterium]
MFKNNKKSYNEEAYKKFLEGLLVDKDIKEEIFNQIDIFSEDGKISFDGNNLYGKIINKKGNDHLEIRYENEYFVCNYTKWNGRNIVNITQIEIKNKNIKIDKKEKIEYICPDNKNETTIEYLEKIYDSKNKLIYKSYLKGNSSYDSLENSVVYKSDSFWSNNFMLEKNWYIENGSIINYKLSKSYFNGQYDLNENYSVCPGSYSDGFGKYYNFINLDEDLFNLFMTGQINIEQLLEQNKTKENSKKKLK